ncbi:DUF4625 domain-containing protein [Sphingobacterium sp. lm-10]|uniref:DUF4625 domain-containing protein n=1 Tax=Sphingobacterium sp. lm-10 TaxID=2944904 RepID=UPI00201FE067|nr:DUF4625 domain-containing protein [Sphingobacterium sp. lm-10]MCL7987201.1 DUF4625 domain-containing protein [Sphingobacterium sp. lm-10]
MMIKTCNNFVKYSVFGIFPVMLLFVTASCGQNTGDSPISNLRINQNKEAEIGIGQTAMVQADIALEHGIADVAFELKNSAGVPIDTIWSSLDDADGQTKYAVSQEIQIPVTLRPGKYWLILSVEDTHSDIKRDSISLNLVLDNTIPIVGDLDVGINKNGSDLHLEAELTAVKKIDRVEVLIKGANWSKDISFDKASIKDQLSTTFHEHVHVSDAPSGAYTVFLTLYDQQGRMAKVEGSFRK